MNEHLANSKHLPGLGEAEGLGEAVIWYLGHSGWAVKSRSHLLIFDYSRGIEPRKGRCGIECGIIDPGIIADEELLVFASHRHFDHYDREIFRWRDSAERVTYFLGWRCDSSEGVYGIEPNSRLTLEDIEIATLRSTDEGVGFLVKVDGLTIFHAGDHANWVDNDPSVSYEREIEYIAQIAGEVDIAFIPVTSFYGFRPECITEGAIFAMKALKPRLLFPMHGNGREELYREFAEEDNVKMTGVRVICAKFPGDSFRYKKGEPVEG